MAIAIRVLQFCSLYIITVVFINHSSLSSYFVLIFLVTEQSKHHMFVLKTFAFVSECFIHVFSAFGKNKYFSYINKMLHMYIVIYSFILLKCPSLFLFCQLGVDSSLRT